MYWIIRMLFRSLFSRGRPLPQLISGIILIPVGGLIAWAALFASEDYYFPYFAVFGVILAIVGIISIIKGLIGLLAPAALVAAAGRKSQPVAGQMPYTNPAQYPQQPYAQPQYPQQQYAQPQYPQQQYAQPQYPQQQPPVQPQYPQQPYPQQQYQQQQYPRQ